MKLTKEILQQKLNDFKNQHQIIVQQLEEGAITLHQFEGAIQILQNLINECDEN